MNWSFNIIIYPKMFDTLWSTLSWAHSMIYKWDIRRKRFRWNSVKKLTSSSKPHKPGTFRNGEVPGHLLDGTVRHQMKNAQVSSLAMQVKSKSRVATEAEPFSHFIMPETCEPLPLHLQHQLRSCETATQNAINVGGCRSIFKLNIRMSQQKLHSCRPKSVSVNPLSLTDWA